MAEPFIKVNVLGSNEIKTLTQSIQELSNVTQKMGETVDKVHKQNTESLKTHKKQTEENTDQIKKFGESSKSTFEQMGTGFKEGTLGALGMGVAIGGVADIATQAAEKLIEFGKEAISEFIKAESTARKLSIAIGNNGGTASEVRELREQAEKLRDEGIFDDDDVKKIMVAGAQFGLTTEQLKRAIPIVTDFAAATGLDLNTAMDKVLRGTEGMKKGLKEFGIEASLSGDKAQNLEEVLDALNVKFGDQNRILAESSIEGKLKNLTNAWEDFKKSLGAGLVDAGIGWKNFFSDASNIAQTLIFYLEGYNGLKAVQAGKLIEQSAMITKTQITDAKRAADDEFAIRKKSGVDDIVILHQIQNEKKEQIEKWNNELNNTADKDRRATLYHNLLLMEAELAEIERIGQEKLNSSKTREIDLTKLTKEELNKRKEALQDFTTISKKEAENRYLADVTFTGKENTLTEKLSAKKIAAIDAELKAREDLSKKVNEINERNAKLTIELEKEISEFYTSQLQFRADFAFDERTRALATEQARNVKETEAWKERVEKIKSDRKQTIADEKSGNRVPEARTHEMLDEREIEETERLLQNINRERMSVRAINDKYDIVDDERAIAHNLKVDDIKLSFMNTGMEKETTLLKHQHETNLINQEAYEQKLLEIQVKYAKKKSDYLRSSYNEELSSEDIRHQDVLKNIEKRKRNAENIDTDVFMKEFDQAKTDQEGQVAMDKKNQRDEDRKREADLAIEEEESKHVQTLNAIDKKLTDADADKLEKSDALAKKIKENNKKIMVETAEAIESASKAITEALATQSQEVQKANEFRISQADSNIETQRTLAARGLSNDLAFEQKRRAELEKSQIEEQRKQKKLKEVEIFENALVTFLKDSGPDSNPLLAITKALGIVAAANTIEGTFEDGGITPLSGGGVTNGIFHGPRHSGGGIRVEVEGGEGILSRKDMSAIGGPSGFMDFRRLLRQPTFEKQVSTNVTIHSNADVVAEIQDLKKVIRDKTEYKLEFDELGHAIETVVTAGIKEVIRHQKPIGRK